MATSPTLRETGGADSASTDRRRLLSTFPPFRGGVGASDLALTPRSLEVHHVRDALPLGPYRLGARSIDSPSADASALVIPRRKESPCPPLTSTRSPEL